MPTIITFNTTKPSWIAVSAVLPSESSNITINNLVYDETLMNSFVFQLYVSYGTAVLNNCTISNIDSRRNDTFASYYGILGSHVEIHNSVFTNITIENAEEDIGFNYGFIAALAMELRNGKPSVTFTNSVFQSVNIIYTHLVSGMLLQQVTVKNCDFLDIKLEGSEPSLFYFTSHLLSDQPDSKIVINNSIFLNLNGGALMILDYGYALMDNVNITTSDFETKNIALFEVHSTAELIMNNINVIYLWADKLDSICRPRSHDSLSMNTYVSIDCNYPNYLLENEGYVAMHDILIMDDIEEAHLREYRDYFIQTVPEYNDSLLFEFYFDAPSNIMDIVSLMINDEFISMTDFTFSGVAMYHMLLLNTGTAIITNMNILRPQFVFDNMDFINTKPMFTAQPALIWNQGTYGRFGSELHCNDQSAQMQCLSHTSVAVLIIRDSFISGVGAVLDDHGYVEIYNTTIINATTAAIALESVTFKLIDCELSNLGVYHLGDRYIINEYMEYYELDPVWWIMHLYNIQNITIENNTFDFLPVNEYIYINNTKKERGTYLEMKNNHFMSPVTLDNYNIDHFEELAKELVSDDINILTATFQTKYPYHMINLEGYIQSSFIGNIFEPNNLITSILGKSCLRILGYEVTESTHCVSGNTFYGNAIEISAAQIKSCAHPLLTINADTTCWTETGPLITDMSTYGNIMIATDIHMPLIKIYEQSQVILDQTVISTNFSYHNSDQEAVYHPFSIYAMNGIVALLDTFIQESDQHSIQIEFYEDCINSCIQLYKDSIIHQFHINCINASNKAPIIELTEKLLTTVSHTLPSKIFLNSSLSFFPGGTLDIDFIIFDSYDNIISDWIGALSVVLSSTHYDFETTVRINVTKTKYQCDVCETGVYIQNARMSRDLYQYHIVTAKVIDNLLSVNNLNISVTDCPSGFGVDTASHCRECNIGEFSIEPSDEACHSCPTELYGVECIGGNKTAISKNYWIGFDIAGESIVSQYCPSNYCNQQHNGFYLDLLESNQLCSLNRDPNTPLCGKCKEGFSEMYGSSNCGECNRDRYELWILFALYSILLTVAIIFMNGISINNKNAMDDDKTKYSLTNCIHCIRKTLRINDEAKEFITISLSKPILYYYQSVTFILLNGGIFVQLSALAEIFNFQLDFGENNDSEPSGYCWIPDLDAKWEIITRLLIPTFCLSTLGIMYSISVFMKGYKLFGREPLFRKSFVRILLLVIGTICAVCFKLVACRDITDEYSVHFYFGAEECRGTTWWISIIMLCFFVILFCGFFVKLGIDHRTNAETNLLQSNEYMFESLVKSYKIDKYWYWEIIMFSRRLLIAMMIVMRGSENPRSNNILFMFIIIYFILQMRCEPFIIDEINTLESICLLSLLFLLYILGNDGYDTDPFSVVLLNILLIIPLIMIIIQFIQIRGTYDGWQHPTANRIDWSPSNKKSNYSQDTDHMDDDNQDKVVDIEMFANEPHLSHLQSTDTVKIHSDTDGSDDNDIIDYNKQLSTAL